MAVPPLSKSQLEDEASWIVIGIVQSIAHTEVRIRQGTNHIYSATVKAIREESPFTDPVEIDEEILVSYWQAGKRRGGRPGDGGQYSPLPIDEEIRMYLGEEKKGVWELLSPNGWEEVE